ncbi:MAG TPA: acetate--CoA ligase family protein [Hyphomicrobiaceae bacterium]|nr:acetate--CoA ligase family protein [Hyphomicrobiaceae bacterium]
MADLKSLLWPQTVALIGASNDADGLRGRILHVMKSHAFAGNFYPVSRSQTEVMGLKAYPSIDALPHPADLAVLIIPAQYVPAELERCGKAGVKSAIILSSGFAEAVGGEGSSLQDEIRAIARRYGMAVMGPNSEGYANTAALLCPTFSPAMEASARPLLPERSPRGQVAVIAQSGGIGFSYFDHGRAKEMSFRYIVTTGNEACLETLDFADFIVDEGKTDALMLLLEDVKNPRMFRKVAEKALRAGVPIIVNKIGQSEAGVRAAASHTAALAGSYDAYRAMFARYGMIEGRDTGEMVDIADGFVAWKHCLPAGRRVAICTASGGGGGWMADACAAAGLDVPELDAGTRARVDVHLPSYGTSQNPVDATAQGVYKIGYAGLLDLVLPSPAIDGVIVVMTARSPANIERQREALERLARETEKPILLWTYTLPAPASVSLLAAAGYPLFTNIQNCARTFRALADYKAMRERFLRPITVRNEPAPETARARDLLAAAGTTLCEWEARPILEAYGLRWGPAGVLATSADDAVRAAREIGGPVALKVQSPGLPHKTEAGAVALNLSSPDEVRAAYARVLDGAKHHAPAADILGVLVQPMAPPGHEVILGIKRDATFGPMLMVGLGGVLVELLQDVALAPVPLDDRQARDLIESLKGARLLRGYRGTPPADVGALATLMAQLSRLAAEHVEDIAEIDLNPVLVHEQGRGVTVVDALIVKSAS